jgi:hypothetical protein
MPGVDGGDVELPVRQQDLLTDGDLHDERVRARAGVVQCCMGGPGALIDRRSRASHQGALHQVSAQDDHGAELVLTAQGELRITGAQIETETCSAEALGL